MRVRELAGADRAGLHPHFAGWLTPEVQCSPGAFWPSLGQLDRAAHVFVAEVGGVPVGTALTAAGGRIDWMLTRPGDTATAFPALMELIYATCGAAGGNVANPALCQAYVDCSAGRLVRVDEDDPSSVWWHP